MGGRRDCYNGEWGTSFRARKWRSLDPCGLACVSLSAGIHCFAIATIASHFLRHSSVGVVLFVVVFSPCTLMALWSLYMAWSSDPGAVPMGARPLYHPSYEQPTLPTSKSEEVDDLEGGAKVSIELSTPLSMPQLISTPSPHPTSQNGDTHVPDIPTVPRTIHRCRKCNDNYKPSRAHHDSVTGRCIVKMDHFCPWVGNAIGALNHKFFLLFIFYTFISCSTAIPIIIIKILPCRELMDELHNSQQRDYRYEDCQKLLAPHVMVLIIVTILFFFFTLCMLADQILAVTKNVSKIARMKIQGGDLSSDELQRVAVDFNEIFGVRHGDKRSGTSHVQWHWFLPLPVEFPPGMKDVIMGYRYVASLPCNEPWWPPEVDNSNRPSTLVETTLGMDHSHVLYDQAAPVIPCQGGSETLTRRLTPSTLETERLVENPPSEHLGQYA